MLKNKEKIVCAVILSFCVIITQELKAFEIPSYIEDPQDVSGNIDIIIRQNTPIRRDSEGAQDLSDQTNETITEYAARLYAEALSTRAQLTKNANASAAEKVTDKILSSSNKQEILQNNVKSQVKNIAIKLKKIVELETAIVNLQNTQLLVGMDEIHMNDVSEENEE